MLVLFILVTELQLCLPGILDKYSWRVAGGGLFCFFISIFYFVVLQICPVVLLVGFSLVCSWRLRCRRVMGGARCQPLSLGDVIWLCNS